MGGHPSPPKEFEARAIHLPIGIAAIAKLSSYGSDAIDRQPGAGHPIQAGSVQTLRCGKNRKGMASAMPITAWPKKHTLLPQARVKAQPQRLNCFPSCNPSLSGTTEDISVDMPIRFTPINEGNFLVTPCPVPHSCAYVSGHALTGFACKGKTYNPPSWMPVSVV